MKYVPSAFVGQLSRSAGSTTASRNRFGSYLRTRVQPVNPTTERQSTVRATLGAASAGYRTLTQVQRNAWAALGLQMQRTDSLGQQYTLTGLQAYTSMFQNMTTASATVISDAPALAPPDAPVGITLTVDTAPADVVSLAYNTGPADQMLVVEMTAPVSPGRNFMPRGAYKLIGTTAIDVAGPFDLLAAYELIYGEFPAGTKIFARAKAIDTINGQSSPWVYTDTIVL